MKLYTISADPDRGHYPLKELAELGDYGLDSNEVIDEVADLQVGETLIVNPYDGILVTRIQ